MVISSSSDKPETLNELMHLKECEFGRPLPRHGLRLLYWLARDCFDFDNYNNSAVLKCDLQSGDFGFCLFENRERYLPPPTEGYVYYAVGNLRKTQDFPNYVTENYNCNQAASNSDRIILSIDPENIIDRIYATEHQGRGSFNRARTYRISKGLMIKIKKLDLSTFLRQVGEDSPEAESHNPPRRDTGSWNFCRIL